MRYLLDTSACIDILRNVSSVTDRLSEVSPDDCAVSTISSFELFSGVEKCQSPDRERRKVEALIDTVHELTFDSPAAIAKPASHRSLRFVQRGRRPHRSRRHPHRASRHPPGGSRPSPFQL